MELRSGRVVKRKDACSFADRLQAWQTEKLPVRDTEGQVLFEFRRDKYHDLMRFIALTGQHVGALMEMTPKLHDEVDDVGSSYGMAERKCRAGDLGHLQA
jgi:hypothetical protein